MAVKGDLTQEDMSRLRRDEGRGRMRALRCSQSLERPRGEATSSGDWPALKVWGGQRPGNKPGPVTQGGRVRGEHAPG